MERIQHPLNLSAVQALPGTTPSRLRRRRLPLWASLLLTLTLLGIVVFSCGGLGLLGLGWLLHGNVPHSPWYKKNDDTIKQFTANFKSGDKSITIEHFEPKTAGKHPLVLVVHGADGLRFEAWLHVYQGHAQELARKGYVALLPHYFERTGSKFGDHESNKAHFLAWLQTLGDALDYAEQQPHIDARRVGLVGVSLGSYLSVCLSATDQRVGALVECVGGIPQPIADNIVRFPPTLILHGDADRLVPVKEAHKLERVLRDKGVSVESKIYPGQGHGFTGEAAQDAGRRLLQFLDQHLKGEPAR